MDSSDDRFALQATFGRYYLTSVLPILAGMLAGSSIVAAMMRGPSWLLALGPVVGGAAGTLVVCGFGVVRARVELCDGQLHVPGIGFKQRLVIPVEQLDTARSSQRSAVQCLLGERALWTRDGQRVLLNERWFAPGRLADLWVRLGCQP